MKKELGAILAGPRPEVRLRLAEERDLEVLRAWKNQNREFFFHKEEISAAQQRRWFEGYLERPHDHIYLVEERDGGLWTAVGVVGCRLLPAECTVDVYNVMRGGRVAENRVNMGETLRHLCDTVKTHYKEPVTCKVLASNPALSWYLRNGFVLEQDRGDYHLLTYKAGDQ